MSAPTTDDLTDRQRQVLELKREGKSTGEIKDALGISSQGVSGHLKRLRTKGLLPPEDEPSARPATSVRKPRQRPAIDPAAAIMAAVEGVRQQRRELEGRLQEIEAERRSLDDEEAGVRAAIERLDAMIPDEAPS